MNKETMQITPSMPILPNLVYMILHEEKRKGRKAKKGCRRFWQPNDCRSGRSCEVIGSLVWRWFRRPGFVDGSRSSLAPWLRQLHRLWQTQWVWAVALHKLYLPHNEHTLSSRKAKEGRLIRCLLRSGCHNACMGSLSQQECAASSKAKRLHQSLLWSNTLKFTSGQSQIKPNKGSKFLHCRQRTVYKKDSTLL